MIENRKVSKFLGYINFFPMDEGNASAISNSQMTNSFIFTTYCLSHFIQNKNKVHFIYISVEFQGDGVQGYRG